MVDGIGWMDVGVVIMGQLNSMSTFVAKKISKIDIPGALGDAVLDNIYNLDNNFDDNLYSNLGTNFQVSWNPLLVTKICNEK